MTISINIFIGDRVIDFSNRRQMYYHLSNDSQNKNNINNKEKEFIKARMKIERDKNFYFLLNETHA